MHVLGWRYDPSVLFNCCTEGAEPDWSQYMRLEVGGCVTDTMPNGDTFTIGGKTDDEAEFWTVYGRFADGDCEAITDCETREDADLVAADLARRSKLPVGDR